jgi:hypothetical protein
LKEGSGAAGHHARGRNIEVQQEGSIQPS